MHEEWLGRLSEYLDGELAPAEQAAVEAHLAGCAECRRVADDLRQVIARAADLPPLPPDRDLWEGIATRIREPEVRSLPVRRRLPLPRLAAAALLLATLGGGAVWLRARSARTGTPVAAAPVPAAPAPGALPVLQPAADVARGTDHAVNDLEQALAAGRERLDTATVRIVTQNLARIDSAIADAERALAADPANAYVSRHLAETTRRKLDLLRRAVTLTQSRS